MNDPRQIGTSMLEAIKGAAVESRGMNWRSDALRDAIVGAARGTTTGLIEDVLSKNNLDLRDRLAAAVPGIMQGMRLAEASHRGLLGVYDESLRTVIARLTEQRSWMDAARLSMSPTMSGIERILTDAKLVEDRWSGGFSAAYGKLMSGNDASQRLRAMVETLNPIIESRQPLASMLRRIEEGPARLLRDIFEPEGLRATRQFIDRVQAERAAFSAALPDLDSPWGGIDWARMQQMVDRAEEQAAELAELTAGPDGPEVDEVTAEDEEEFAQSLRPVVAAIEAASSSSVERDAKLQEAITHLVAYPDRRDARLTKQGRAKHLQWGAVVLSIVVPLARQLAAEWAASHTTPMIDRALGLLDTPVSIQEAPSDIRRDAAAAVDTHDIAADDAQCLRVVVRKSVTVFDSPEPASTPIHRIPSGKVVAALQREGKWRRVEWRDPESGEIQAGWVRERYLAQISR
jgi:hypothetical protein